MPNDLSWTSFIPKPSPKLSVEKLSFTKTISDAKSLGTTEIKGFLFFTCHDLVKKKKRLKKNKSMGKVVTEFDVGGIFKDNSITLSPSYLSSEHHHPTSGVSSKNV